MKKYLLLILILIGFNQLSAKNPLVQSGPMLGYSDVREVLIWLQTTKSVDVYAKYFNKENPKKVFKTEKIKTNKDNAFIAKMIADSVEPGKRYTYEIYINNRKVNFEYPLEFQSQLNWKWRQEAPDFSFIFGSCFYVNDEKYDRAGKEYGGEYFIFNEMYKHKPDFMVWLGDNVYLREGDWNSKTGIYYRWTHSRSIPEIQPYLASVHQYGTWDDHDYGPNDSDRGFWNKKMTRQAFIDFHGNPEPIYDNEGITTRFEWSDCEFFLLDNRWWKSPNGDSSNNKNYFGRLQIRWLIDNLISSTATFKFICTGGQILNPVQVFENYSNYESEKKYLFEQLENNNIKGVIFLTGDRHFSELSKLRLSNGKTIFDFTSSTFTAGFYKDACKENNTLRVDNTCYAGRNFAKVEVSGKTNERVLKFSLYDNKGNKLWEYLINQKELE